MKNVQNTFLLLFLLLISFVVSSCNSRSAGRDLIVTEIEILKENLPYKMPDSDMVFADANIDNNMVVYKYLVPQQLWDFTNLTMIKLTPEEFMTNIILSDSVGGVKRYAENGFGFKYIYSSIETEDELYTLEITANEIQEIYNNLQNDEITEN